MKHLSSAQLLANTKTFIDDERRATVALIEHLAEISRRKLFAELGYSSMWEFCTQELGLSEGAAQRRLQAMRLFDQVPEAAQAIESGTLSLSNAAKVQSFIQNQKKTGTPVPDARYLVEQVESKSQRECEAHLLVLSPEALPRERDRIVSGQSDHELRITISAELHHKLQQIKGLLAHARPDATYVELLEYMAELTLTKLQKQKGIPPEAATANAHSNIADARQPGSNSTAAAAVTSRKLPPGIRVYLPAVLRRAVFRRALGQCEIIGSTGRRCTSRYRLEIDHLRPLALGGSNDFENLRVACRVHNLRQAESKLGPTH